MARKVVIGRSCMRYWEAAVDAAQAGRSREAGENLRKYNDCMFGAMVRGFGTTFTLARPLKRASGRASKRSAVTRRGT
jgi:hypothetical protein